MPQDVIKIHAINMDDRSCEILDFYFQKFCGGQCEITLDIELAQVFLINMDGIDANSQLTAVKQQFPSHAFILTSIKVIDAGQDYFLRKPMVAKHLLDIINNIKSSPSTAKKDQTKTIQQTNRQEEPSAEKTLVASIQSRHSVSHALAKTAVDLVGKAEDVNLRSPADKNTVFFKLEEYFVGVLRQAYLKAKQEHQPVIIRGLWHPITLFPETNQIYIEISERQIKSISAVTLKASSINTDEITIEVLSAKAALLQCPQHKYYYSLDGLMWKLALWTARGRFPQELPLDSPLYLLGWPNLTRLVEIPESMRICACWVPHPRTILNLTDLLAIPQRYIFSLITATYVLGMSGLAVRQSDTLILPPTPEPTTKMGLLSRIVKKLRIKG